VKELDKAIRKYMEAMHYGLSSTIQNPEREYWTATTACYNSNTNLFRQTRNFTGTQQRFVLSSARQILLSAM
jgi:hypothetical protein